MYQSPSDPLCVAELVWHEHDSLCCSFIWRPEIQVQAYSVAGMLNKEKQLIFVCFFFSMTALFIIYSEVQTEALNLFYMQTSADKMCSVREGTHFILTWSNWKCWKQKVIEWKFIHKMQICDLIGRVSIKYEQLHFFWPVGETVCGNAEFSRLTDWQIGRPLHGH